MRQSRSTQGSIIPAVFTPSAASVDVASANAGAIYTLSEQTLINELKTSLNDLKAKLRTAGILLT